MLLSSFLSAKQNPSIPTKEKKMNSISPFQKYLKYSRHCKFLSQIHSTQDIFFWKLKKRYFCKDCMLLIWAASDQILDEFELQERKISIPSIPSYTFLSVTCLAQPRNPRTHFKILNYPVSSPWKWNPLIYNMQITELWLSKYILFIDHVMFTHFLLSYLFWFTSIFKKNL